MSNNAVETLLKERDRLVLDRDAAVARFNTEIRELETAIEKLAGKKVWDIEGRLIYDDEHPDYIRQSVED